jgi:DNA-binding MarR family transcriptional regulator
LTSAPSDGAPAHEAFPADDYRLDDQVGFILRQANQRHTALFVARFGALTATQWAALSKLAEVGATSQNLLGRLTAMDVATINGVVDRLSKKGLVSSTADLSDARRRLLDLTAEGRAYVAQMIAVAHEVTRETLAPLSPRESATLLALLRKLA